MVSAVRTTVRVTDDLAVDEFSFTDDRGEPCAWVSLGERGELGLYGPGPALRRLAGEIVGAANAAERRHGRGQAKGAPLAAV